MAARVRPVWLASLLAVAGCIGDGGSLPLVAPTACVPPQDFKPTTTRAAYPPASQEAVALRVNQVCQKLLTANRRSGLYPVFQTVGSPTPEIFHRGVGELYVTEGLTKLCQRYAQLAALLALEMGKMVAEREALAGPTARRAELRPPLQSGVGVGVNDTFGQSDPTHTFELAKYEQERRQARKPAPLPDAQALARSYLARAGYGDKDLDAAAPIVKAARANVKLERQVLGTMPAVPLVK